ncbi:holo-ACP synthase [Mesobacillus maritimus]|uniref:holo-ACP synthase n=1 Tax=Mesobacillus maritimus TaxID=1643336 RepID=UPI00203A79A6|nr:holo-ACP synthase [Mesobacillus maritimus]MCM3671962.1 holo-ACP synthase [Mesobacillus maritimus]
MITGIGLDIVEISRIAVLFKKQPRFPERILTEEERKEFCSLSDRRKIEFLAGRFAAKEAFAKAFGTGIGKDLSFQDIEIKKNERGKPFFIKPISEGIHLSITHSRDFAAAQVIIERN